MTKNVLFSAIVLIGMAIASYGANHVKAKELSENKISLNFSDNFFE